MNGRFLVFFSLFLWAQSLSAQATSHLASTELPAEVQAQLPQNEDLRLMDNLICATEVQLRKQKHIAVEIHEFTKIRDQLVAQPDNLRLATEVVKVAHQLLENIQDNHMTELFTRDFMDELHFFSELNPKTQVPTPR